MAQTKRTRPLKVWTHNMEFPPTTLLPDRYREGNSTRFQCRAMVAATSRKAAAWALGVSEYFLKEYGAEGCNPADEILARANPGQVYWQPVDAGSGRGTPGQPGYRGRAPWAKSGHPWVDRDTSEEVSSDG